MNKDLIIIQGIIITLSIIVLIVIRDREINKNQIKILISLSNLTIFVTEIQLISKSNYITLFIVLTILSIYIYKQKNQEEIIPKINVVNTQNSDRKAEQEFELPQQLPAIPSIHESNSSMTPNNIITNDNNQRYQYQEKIEQNTTHIKKDSGMSFLGEHKRSSYNNSNGMMISRQQSVLQIQPNLNVIKFHDDFGEVKFGILQTLKSVSYDQVGKEVDIIMKNEPEKQLTHLLSTVEKTTNPRMQILYESQQPQQFHVDDNLKNGIQFDDIQPQQQKIITWKQIIKELLCLIIINLNFLRLQLSNIQILLIIIIILRQIGIICKLKINELQIKFELRELFIWFLIIILPLLGFIINIGQLEIAQWITLIITLKYYKCLQEYVQYLFLYLLVLVLLFFLNEYIY